MQNFSAEVITRSLGEVGSTVFFILVGTVILELILYGVFGRLLKSRYTLPIMLLGPAAVGLAVLIVYPLLWEFNLSFTNMSLRRFGDEAATGAAVFRIRGRYGSCSCGTWPTVD